MNNVGNPFANPRILSYCPGILGLERGLKRAVGSIRTVAYVEIEAFICENLLAGMEAGLVDAAPIWLNLKTFDPAPFRGRVDGIIGGYPCQPFSHAGERKGTDDPRHLYPYLEQHIRTIRPVWCFFENVSGHLSLGFAEVRESLSNLGYSVEAGIFTAEEVGAPHQRERLFILAIRREYLAYAESAGIGGRERHLHTSYGRQDGELQQQLNGSGGAVENSADNGQQRGEQQPAVKRNVNGVSTQGDGQLANTGYNDGRECEFKLQQEERAEEFQRGVELPHGNSSGYVHGESEKFTAEGREYAQRIPQSGDKYEVADSNNSGSEQDTNLRELWADSVKQPSVYSGFAAAPKNNKGGFDRWPARPGQPQYEWESPRTESSVGYAIDGYNYREDLLRAAGNSVVEQTAELAFRELLKKF